MDPVAQEYFASIGYPDLTPDQMQQYALSPEHMHAIESLRLSRGESLGFTPATADQRISSYYEQILGRRPDDSAYLAANPDVAAAIEAGDFRSGAHHYALHGQNEGRQGADDDLANYGQQVNALVAGQNPADALATFRMNRDLGEQPVVPGFGRYQEMARLATAGMNRMPFVFSDYVGMMGGDAFGRQPRTANMGNFGTLFSTATGGMQNPILAGTQPAPQAQQPGNPLLQGGDNPMNTPGAGQTMEIVTGPDGIRRDSSGNPILA